MPGLSGCVNRTSPGRSRSWSTGASSNASGSVGGACTVCPAKVYEWEEHSKKILVAYENCIECGACRMLCPFQNIKCDWPNGGFGVQYQYG